jgi:hypothetical protein
VRLGVLSLRFPWLWLSLGWAIVAGVIFGSVAPDVLGNTFDFSGADKLGHAASYFLLVIWFSGLYARHQLALLAVTMLALGLILEIIQWQLPYREFDLADLLANASGIVLGLGFSVWLFAGWCQRMERRLGYHD